jgi:MFS family permease
MNNSRMQWKMIGILGFTQISAWGSVFYAFALLAPELQRETGWRPDLVYGAFSWGLLVAGLSSTPAGMLIDRFGGRFVMGAGSLVAGAGLLLLGMVHTLLQYYLIWTLLGIGMALVLYEAAFATINREFQEAARRGISTLTLFGGFASTVAWPLTLKLNAAVGWRETYFAFGLVQLALCLPLHLLLPVRRKTPRPAAPASSAAAQEYSLKQVVREPMFWLLAGAFATNSFVFSGLGVHLIPLLHKLGHPTTTVVVFAAFIGPMQVIGRIGEMLFARHASPAKVSKLTFLMLPTALTTLLLMGMHQSAIAAFCLMYGLSNGIMTIVRGTLPRALFGQKHYGAIAGALAGPTLISQALSPLAIAAINQAGHPPSVVLATLLSISLASLCFYFTAIRHPQFVVK